MQMRFSSFDEAFAFYDGAEWLAERTGRGVRYRPRPDLGTGSIEFMGDLRTHYFVLSDLCCREDFFARSRIVERYVEVADTGFCDVQFYRRRGELLPVLSGLNAYVNAMPVRYFMRAAGGTPLLFCGFCLRERFFEENGVTLPQGFWGTAARLLNPGVLSHPPLTALCRQVRNTALFGGAFEVYLRGRLLEAVGYLLDFIARNGAGNAVRISPGEAEAVERAKAILKEDLVCPPTVQVLAETVGLNRNKLQAGFRDSEGKSVAEYLRALRMEWAMDILEREEVPVREVAERVGYRSPINFYRAFGAAFGVSPGAMRRMLRPGACCDDV